MAVGPDGVMQVPGCRSGYSDAGPLMFQCRSSNVLMQVRGWCNTGPLMVQYRSPDVQILETETLSVKVGALW